ncbi:hypothetical protein N4R57_10700 [Rhodobacteraceae bacterium D3-12]|nr:hypothetical protein N4R57_10700 [Rhodobacteraceae bacterium D3-12]
MAKGKHETGRLNMGRIIKWLFILAILAVIALVGYAYIGPFFGADFSPPQQEIRVTIELDAS